MEIRVVPRIDLATGGTTPATFRDHERVGLGAQEHPGRCPGCELLANAVGAPKKVGVGDPSGRESPSQDPKGPSMTEDGVEGHALIRKTGAVNAERTWIDPFPSSQRPGFDSRPPRAFHSKSSLTVSQTLAATSSGVPEASTMRTLAGSRSAMLR